MDRFADETVVRGAQIMTPDLANFVGNVHGGHVVRFADNLAYACASRFAGVGCTTAAIERVDLVAPVPIGDLLHLTAQVVYTGHTSLDVEVIVEAENLTSGELRRTTLCAFTLVALVDGKPAPVPRVVPRSREDKLRWLNARDRRRAGDAERAAERDDPYAAFDDGALDAAIADG